MFDLVKAAGVRPHDLAGLLGVSRCTVSTWFNDHAKPHSLIQLQVGAAVAAVLSAVDSGDLPLPRDTPVREKTSRMAAVLRKHLETQ